jgi:hypothetical protein
MCSMKNTQPLIRLLGDDNDLMDAIHHTKIQESAAMMVDIIKTQTCYYCLYKYKLSAILSLY